MRIDADGLPGRVVPVPVIEARYSALRAVKGGLAWRRGPVSGVLGESGAEVDDASPSPALERYDLRKREVTELADELDWFDVSGDGTCLVVCYHGELRVMPSSGKRDDDGESVTVDTSRARFTADPAALWRHAYAEAGRIVRRDFWTPDMSGVDWDGVLAEYRPLLDRIRGAADFADLLWELLGELGTSHGYVDQADDDGPGRPAGRGPAGRGHLPGWFGAVDHRPGAAGRVVRPAGPLAAIRARGDGTARRRAGRGGRPAGRPGARPVAAAGRHRRQAGRADRAGRPSGEPATPVVVVPLRGERRLRYQDWVAGRRRLVRELSRRAARLPAHPGHDGGGLGPLPP